MKIGYKEQLRCLIVLKNKPELRFIGFENDWIYQSLDKVTERITRKNKNNESKLPLTISAQYGLVDQITYFNKQIASIDLSNYYLLQNGDFAYNKSYSKDYPWGVVKRLDKYKEGVLSSLYIVFKPLKVHSDFLVSYYETSRWHKEVSMRATEGARNHGLLNISAADFLKTNLSIPIDFEEQKKIGIFFKKLDNTIDLHQQELDALKQTKQGFLQKMFPKNGETEPSIRFDNSTKPWTLKKFEMICENFEYGLNASAKEFDGTNQYIRITDIDDESRTFSKSNVTSPDYDLSSAESYLLQYGDLLFARTGASVGKTYLYREGDGIVYFAGFLIRGKVRKIYDSEFVFQNTLTSSFKEFIKISSQRSGQPGINAKEIADYSILVPEYDEQTKIGNFFRKLDEVIKLKEKELEALKQTKKGFLQKIFV